MKEIKYLWEAETYSVLLYQYQVCVKQILEINNGFETIIKSEVEKLNEDITKFRRVINELTLDKTDTFEEEFQDEENHPIIYLDKGRWEILKSYYKKLKEVVLNKVKEYGLH